MYAWATDSMTNACLGRLLACLCCLSSLCLGCLSRSLLGHALLQVCLPTCMLSEQAFMVLFYSPSSR